MDSAKNQPSPELLELILFALDHGLESVRDGGPLIPFLLTTGSGRPTLQRFVTDSLDRSREMAVAAASQLPADVNLYAFAVDGYLRAEAESSHPQDAIIVEAGQRGSGFAFLFAQTYRPQDVTQDFQVLSQPACVGETTNRLA
jgi:hypothetical protein